MCETMCESMCESMCETMYETMCESMCETTAGQEGMAVEKAMKLFSFYDGKLSVFFGALYRIVSSFIL